MIDDGSIDPTGQKERHLEDVRGRSYSDAHDLLDPESPERPDTSRTRDRSDDGGRYREFRPDISMIGRIRNQYLFFRTMTARHFSSGSLRTQFQSTLQTGAFVFLFATFIALLMENEIIYDNWETTTKYGWYTIISLLLLSMPLTFFMTMNIEINQGTLKSICLYPVGVNTLISSKIAMAAIAITGGILVAVFAGLPPFLLLDVISWTYASRLIVITLSMHMAVLLIMSAGAFYSNIHASSHRHQMVVGYSMNALATGFMMTYLPVRIIAGFVFALFDPNDRFLGDPQANFLAQVVSRFSPFETAYQWSNVFVSGGTLDLSYGVSILFWLTIAYFGIRAGPRVYMDVFFRGD